MSSEGEENVGTAESTMHEWWSAFNVNITGVTGAVSSRLSLFPDLRKRVWLGC